MSEAARYLVTPTGIVSTSWPEVRSQCDRMGLHFDPWQDGLGQVMLGKRADGRYAATIGGIVMSIARQTGKSHLITCTAVAMCVLHPGLTIVWTAHHLRTSDETFRNMQALARQPKVAPYLSAVRQANGQQSIEFRDPLKPDAPVSRIIFGARSQGFGRGFAGVDILVLDEIQHTSTRAIEDLSPILNASKFPAGALMFMMGTPPRPVDNGEVFSARRAEALSGESDDMVYVEFSADPDAKLSDPVQWAKANPSYPHRTGRDAIMRMRKVFTNDASFRREALGIWSGSDSAAVIDADSWRLAGDEFSAPASNLALAVDVAPNLRWASVALAGQREDGQWHIEVDQTDEGTDWVVPHVQNLLDKNPGAIRAVVVDAYSPAAPLLDRFKEARIKVSVPRTNDVGTACARLFDGVMQRSVHHIFQPQLEEALVSARKRDLGTTGMWAWARKDTASDITPVVAVTLALWGAQSQDRIVRPQRKSAGAAGKPKVRYV